MRLRDAVRRLDQPFAVGVFAETHEELPDESLHRRILYRCSSPPRPRCTRSRATPTRSTASAPMWPRPARRSRIWSARLAKTPTDFESAWKLARAAYWLGGHDEQAARRADLERGVEAGRQASMLEPTRPEGLLLDGRVHGPAGRVVRHAPGAEVSRRRSARRSRRCCRSTRPTRTARPTARWDAGTTRCRGCSAAARRSRRSTCASRSPTTRSSTASRFFLAETLFELDRKADAIAELQRVIDGPVNPEWEPEDREFKQQAADRLKKERR